ncbi:hypothetical protein EDB92DRAFT_513579 [Lactarius akahatsu]|uniref:C2H2-type domain-containing protein n=1 Tax=Lactarius akahatsu TaxID=416441 RepID=A0AAD4LLK8_9AGAM|nr:hypothetical protein EDB92DRAFT_513579 [Lactarius akahatsu]
MSDYSTVKSPSSGTTNLPEIDATSTDFPDSYLRAEKPSGDATDSSTASSSAAHTASSRTTSAEATDATTLYTSSSSSPPPPPPSKFSSSLIPALVPPWSPTRIPARLRRKCPLYAEQAKYQCQREGDDDEIVATAKSKSTSEEEDGALLVPETPAAGPIARSTSPPPKAPRSGAVRRARVPPPVPVPYLIKKSRGRQVPEPASAQERAHVCAVPGCLKSFARAEHLKRHVLSLHTYEKPFACGCGKTFARRDNLLQHQRVHATTT